jgi:excisionase family DNA binding protein
MQDYTEHPISVGDLLTVRDVANYLNVSRSWVYEMVNHGYLPYFQFNSAIRIHRNDLSQFISRSRRIKTFPYNR